MALPFDIEDIIGAGCLATIGRFVAGVSCIWLGSLAGVLSLVAAESVVSVWGGSGIDFDVQWLGWMVLAAPVAWLFTSWGFAGLVLLVATFLYFVKSDGGSLRVWVGLSAAYGLLTVVARMDWNWREPYWTAFPILAGFLGAIAVGAAAWMNWQRRHFAEHLMAVAVENERQRPLQEAESGPGGPD
ncbi:MAG: hypothetical protein HKN82_17845 [Akkermansiaceae bacterium]|nr:hypothetical protein [Akkermansiaceae bacterium]NNM28766.1 hypothetical protein [Akkermansiaceae bacterium]